jgi:hypothetical protein
VLTKSEIDVAKFEAERKGGCWRARLPGGGTGKGAEGGRLSRPGAGFLAAVGLRGLKSGDEMGGRDLIIRANSRRGEWEIRNKSAVQGSHLPHSHLCFGVGSVLAVGAAGRARARFAGGCWRPRNIFAR